MDTETQFRDFIEKSIEGVIVVDCHGIVRYFNPAARHIFSRHTDTLLDQPLGMPLVSGETTEIEILQADGKVHLFEMRASESAWGEESANIVWLRDITLRRQEEEALRQAKEAAESASRLKSEFMSTMRHELRTPLNSIIGFSELLRDELAGPLNEKQKQYACDVAGSSRHLLAILNDILDLSAMEAGEVLIEHSKSGLQNVVMAAFAASRPQAEEKNIRLSGDADLDFEITADQRCLRRILNILLSNAVKFTPEGGSVRVAARRIAGHQLLVASRSPLASSNEQQATGFLEISVADTGIGIAKKDQEKIFQPFSQTDSSPSRRFDGIGLGLALCRKLVELHGGKIRVESEPGKGSTFYFSVPLEDGL